MTPEEAKALGYEELDYPDREPRPVFPAWLAVLSLIIAALAWLVDLRFGWVSVILGTVWVIWRWRTR
jgi:hypothetical protein